jgi:leucyl-tRNA synthetase
MASDYDPKEIEPKWQKIWEENKPWEAKTESDKPKYYSLVEFPYPSGEGLHTGHVRSYTAMDIISRKRRREDFNVLYPIGWDAFGLPAENYAIKTGIQPAVTTAENIQNYRKQLKSLGIWFDWSREVNTTDPAYYRWTQWLFLQFHKHGLAYKAKMNINWCPKDKIGLANEEVVDGKCERCGTPVEQREKEQWMLAITKYAERLDKDLDEVDFQERIKIQQRNWIGKSEGAEIDFLLDFKMDPKLNENRGPNGEKAAIKVFTTRPETIFGATYLVLAPDHLWVKLATDDTHNVLENKGEIKSYISKLDRNSKDKEKTGVEIKGVKAINPATKEEISIWVADYVSADYATGAIMAVPADDERDREFAEKFKLPIVQEYKKANFEDFGIKVTKFKLRDWIFSRQRYWGEPIPMIHCEKDGWVPVPESDLPVKLPEVDKYEPTDSGESPLASISEWTNVTCPKCGGPAKRETDTMPNWAGSSWYFLRYADPFNDKDFASKEALKHWMPVDWYNGGMEHTTLHLLYSRFWNKFLFDLGLVPTSEPYKKRTSHGLILAEGGEKMSKSKGNVVNPDKIVDMFGADTLRVYEMFMGPFEQAIAWSESALVGPRRFIERVWKLRGKVVNKTMAKENEYNLHYTIKKVSGDIESLGFNTAVSTLMIYTNALEKQAEVSQEEYEFLLKLLSPFAPHVTEELWQSFGHQDSIHSDQWPSFDEAKLTQQEIKIGVQINGKPRSELIVKTGTESAELENMARNTPEIAKWLEGREVVKIIVVPGKVVNIVTT